MKIINFIVSTSLYKKLSYKRGVVQMLTRGEGVIQKLTIADKGLGIPYLGWHNMWTPEQHPMHATCIMQVIGIGRVKKQKLSISILGNVAENNILHGKFLSAVNLQFNLLKPG